MSTIHGLEPRSLWLHFQEISRIPRESGNEAGIRRHILDIAEALGLESRTDDAGNVIVLKPGKRGIPPVALQSHMDMVCEKDTDVVHDFGKDPITLVRDGEWIRASGTTLGADNGIGVAAMLSIMEDKTLEHPPLELLFTAEEETGLTGAARLTRGSFSANTLLNLDSEEDDTFTIGCAGGMDTEIVIEPDFMPVPEGTRPVMVRITGLKGGHSGVDIHRGRGNAIKLLSRFLSAISPSYGIHLSTFQGGSKHNAIPREAEAVIVANASDIEALRQETVHWNSIFRNELEHFDDNAVLVLDVLDHPALRVLEPEETRRVLNLLQAIPHGPLKTDPKLDNTVVTSTNLAICSLKGDEFILTTSQRSIFGSALHEMADQVAAVGELAGCRINQKNAYPAWRPNLSSPILNICSSLYRSQTGADPMVRVVHAGLECAVIGERIKGMDMISFGPAVEQAHSPHERVKIAGVARFWEYLVALLRHMTVKGR